MRKTVADLMSVDFVTVTARMSLDEALNLLVESDMDNPPPHACVLFCRTNN